MKTKGILLLFVFLRLNSAQTHLSLKESFDLIDKNNTPQKQNVLRVFSSHTKSDSHQEVKQEVISFLNSKENVGSKQNKFVALCIDCPDQNAVTVEMLNRFTHAWNTETDLISYTNSFAPKIADSDKIDLAIVNIPSNIRVSPEAYSTIIKQFTNKNIPVLVNIDKDYNNGNHQVIKQALSLETSSAKTNNVFNLQNMFGGAVLLGLSILSVYYLWYK